MREIKFKGKNKDIGWVYGQLAYDINGNAYIILEVELDASYGFEETMLFATMWHKVDKETLGQFTGLNDKNGKETYEGDIVYIIPEDERGIIRWDNETARYVVVYDNIITDFDNWYGKDLEVIGNIYDNPELLEEGE